MQIAFSEENSRVNPESLISTPSVVPILAIRKRRILVADDHAIFRECLIKLLQDSPGLDVIGDAADGRQAVELAILLRPDIILMDVDMPNMNGIEATRAIAASLPQVRVIGLSMHDQQSMEAQMRAAGAEAYFVKDGPIEELLATIKS
jgi:DNA-binding NarL/FixJ family response regulator